VATGAPAPDLSSLVRYIADLLLNRIWDPKVSEDQREEVIRFLGLSAARLSLENPPIVGVVEAIQNPGEPKGRFLEFLTTVVPETLNFRGLLNHIGLQDLPFRARRIGRIIPCGPAVQGGQSIGHFTGTNGSIGCVVKDTFTGGATYLLGCNHVLAALNQGSPGKDDIWSPSINAGGGKNSVVGRLSKFKEIVMLPEMLAANAKPNLMDAALCEISADIAGLSPKLNQIGQLRGVNNGADLELDVKKEGWKTKLTTGSLQMAGSILVHFSSTQVARFDDQLAIYTSRQGKDFALQGDSGSVVVDKENKVVGLLFAMAEGMKIGYASPIQPILDEFGVDVVL
jgi:hypothetical protein